MEFKIDKTTIAIEDALISLLKEEDYENISITDVIKRADISRSTFYAHFKKKNDIIIAFINDIMNHVFEHHQDNYVHMLEHIFSHFKGDREEVKAILDSGASHIFRKTLRNRLSIVIDSFYASGLYGKKEVPSDVARHQYLNDLVALIQYYIYHGYEKYSPEQMVEYHFSLFR